jgi:catechol 2,3-dioxygenase-like lactoylglutathione lyase family enzyme
VGNDTVTTVRTVQVTFDCADPERLARFWCEVLGYVMVVDGDAAADPNGVGPRLFFQRVPEGKVVKNRVHLDVRVGTGLVGAERVAALEAECARLVALGAVRVRLLEADEENESCLVMQDIEGNEFCLD